MSLINVKYNKIKSLIIGGGKIAYRKAKNISSNGGEIVVVSTEFIESFNKMRNLENVKLIRDEFSDKYLDGKMLVICATDDTSLNKLISEKCNARGILVNNVSNKELSSFYNVSVYESKRLEIGVSTKGLSPGISIAIKDLLGDMIGERVELLIEEYSELKEKIKMDSPDNKEELLEELSKDYYRKIIGGIK
jgi:precorrin-2 dehydrogenase/sirohydrochlorin ferrochelatase